jgi:hypothetical protein
MNEKVIAGQSIETLLAVLMFVMMGITLERSRIANDLLTTMARVFGPLPGGLAVSIVMVGAFLAASTGIVGATVVTMGLLALPTMLRNNYSPELATGVIAASGTLGQIIPPSIVIVLLGTLAGDLYSLGQEERAQIAGCRDALTFLGEPAVLSVGTLFQAALLPGIFLAGLYAAYAFGFALVNPAKAPAVELGASSSEPVTRNEALTWFLGVPAALILGISLAANGGLVGSQAIFLSDATQQGETASLRTNVSEQCQASMIELHGQEAWDTAVAERASAEAAAGSGDAEVAVSLADMTEEELATLRAEVVAAAAPIGSGLAAMFILLALILAIARGVSPTSDPVPLIVGGCGDRAGLHVRYPVHRPDHEPGHGLPDPGDPDGPHALRYTRGVHPAGAQRPSARGLPAAHPDRGGSGLHPRRDHQPDASGGARGCGCDHAGGLPEAEGGKRQVEARDLGEFRHRDHDPAWREFRPARHAGGGAVRRLGGLCAGADRLSLRVLRASVLLLGAVPVQHPQPGGARDGEGHLDGLHHSHRLAASEPGADLLRGGASYPAVPAKFRQRDGRFPRGDADPVHPGLRAGFPRDHLHRRPIVGR